MGEGRKYQVTGTANTINPAIAAENDNVYLIMQTDQNGNQDIVCYYSLDGGENYEMSIIADSVEDELFPEVYASGDYANVIFLKGNNLFSALTSDGGETWEISERLNDLDGSVVDWKRTSDIYGNKVVWTDNRGDNYAIYIDDLPSSGAAPTNPTVTYNKQNDELTLSSTDPDGDQIRYGVSWNNNQNVDTWTEFIDSGAEAKVDCEGRTGKVGVIAEDSTGLQSGWVSVTPKSKIMIWSLLEKFPMLNNIIRVIFF
jgi:hypothetical protein